VLYPAEFRDLRNGRIVFAQYRSGPLEEEFAALGQDHTSRRSREQRQAQILLELSDLHRDSCLRYMYTFRAGRERFCFGYRKKGS
jgi:hypothetical protein